MSSFPISATQASATSAGANSNRFSELSSEEFIQIIFTELSNQDPFKPNDSSALLEQLNSIRSIESDTQLTKQLSSIVTQNQLATAGNLIGRQVQGLTPDSDRVAGTVVSVARQNDKVSLLLDNGWVVPMENVETIVDPSIFGFGGD
jgi:flagellar basal-body rod modification protein FlgD